MSTKFILSQDLESKMQRALLKAAQGQHAESEQLLLELIRESSRDADRYFLFLYYGELLLGREKWEESRDFLARSAQIALDRKDHQGLALSHERLGDLSAAEEDWFSALHHYRYALRIGGSFLAGSGVDTLEAKANVALSMLHSTILSQDASIILLSKEYVSGNMAISFVHRDIFLKNYFARCLECNFCHDWCCSFGADIDIQNVEKIQQHREGILPFIRASEVEWFNGDYTYYEEYAGNQYTRINPQGPRCVFISKDQRGCGLHRYAISKQMDYHEIKPLICTLFPLSFEVGILSLAEELDDDSLICSGSGDSAYQAMKSELEYYFGRELVQELDVIEKKTCESRLGD